MYRQYKTSICVLKDLLLQPEPDYILQQWIENFPSDFDNPEMLRILQSYCESKASATIVYATQKLVQQFCDIGWKETKKVDWALEQKDLDDFYSILSPKQMAHQLTHIELDRIHGIGLNEFIICLEKSASLKTVNLNLYIDWFNRVSYIVAAEVVKVIMSKIHIGFNNIIFQSFYSF